MNNRDYSDAKALAEQDARNYGHGAYLKNPDGSTQHIPIDNLVITMPPQQPAPRKKGLYIGAPACFALDLACRHVNDAFGEGSFGIYVVGSVLERPDWRDVDVRMIMADEAFQNLFPEANVAAESWELDSRWLMLTVMVSKFISEQTGLPVDFQFQPQTHANKRHSKPRNAIGMRLAKRAGADAKGDEN